MLSLYDHVFEAIVVLDLQKKVVHFNPAFTIFTKQPPRILRNIEFLHQLFDTKDFDFENWIDQGCLKLELRVSPELELIHVREKNYTSHVVLRQFPVQLPEGTFLALAFHDLSIERNLFNKYRLQLEELRSTHAQIIQADKLATLGEMTATISHEISNPLTIASGNSELIEAYLDMPEPQNSIKEIASANTNIRESIDRIHAIIRNMKNFLWQNEDNKEYCGLSDAVQISLEWLKSPIEQTTTVVETKFNTQDTIVLANRIKLEQVIINLVKNAIDAMEEAKTPGPKIKIEINRDETDHSLIMMIIDNGPGMPQSVKDNLFKPFTTTKKVGQGTGLGLSISQKIIESHQGQIELVDTDVGTAFKIRFPTIEGYSFTRGDKVSRGISSRQGPRILIVDNEPQILNVLSRFLEDEGHHVIASARPEEALRFIHKMNVDLLLTDLSMPGMTGHEVAKKAREQGHQGPILYMSSSKNTDAYNRDRDTIKIAGMIVKPFSRDEVIRTIKSALGGKS
jgi:signal transduction histidine kinase/CheY-like chemotaxis protein